ncbi:polysaccharide deacetylase family protein [Chloroflexota bacterium]
MSPIGKQKIERLIASAANHLGFIAGYSFFRALNQPQVAILMYHSVGTQENLGTVPIIRPHDFEDQIAYLCRWFEIMPFDKLVQCVQSKGGLPKRAAVITFDDGYKDIYLYAYPILKRYNVPATIFLTTGHIGTANPFWWDKVGYIIKNTKQATFELDELGAYSLRSNGSRLKTISRIVEGLKKVEDEKKELLIERLMTTLGMQLPANLGKELILSWDDVREMNDGDIAFGAHSITHPILTKLSLKQAEYEIVQSKKDIEEKLNRVVTAFSYPNGQFSDFNSQIKKILKKSSFTCAFTTIPRMITPGIDLYELPRIDPGWDFNTFKVGLSGLYPDLGAILSRI